MQKTHKYYEMTPKEKQEMWMKKMNYIWFNKDREFYFRNASSDEFNWSWLHQGQGPMGLHFDMFTTSVDMMMNEEQQNSIELLIKKLKKFHKSDNPFDGFLLYTDFGRLVVSLNPTLSKHMDEICDEWEQETGSRRNRNV